MEDAVSRAKERWRQLLLTLSERASKRLEGTRRQDYGDERQHQEVRSTLCVLVPVIVNVSPVASLCDRLLAG